jgi:hypothetical protein
MVEIGDLTEPQRATLAAIVQGKLAWSPMAELQAGGHSEAIEELISLGLAARWGEPWIGHLPEDRVTLTPFGAWLLDVHILERTTIDGEDLSEDPYWAETSQEPRSIHLPRRHHEVRCPWMDELPDPKSLRKSGEVMRDDEGEPVKVMGRVVPIDPKLKGKARKAG